MIVYVNQNTLKFLKNKGIKKYPQKTLQFEQTEGGAVPHYELDPKHPLAVNFERSRGIVKRDLVPKLQYSLPLLSKKGTDITSKGFNVSHTQAFILQIVFAECQDKGYFDKSSYVIAKDTPFSPRLIGLNTYHLERQGFFKITNDFHTTGSRRIIMEGLVKKVVGDNI